MLSGNICYLRAVEVSDVDIVYRWENDAALWSDGSVRQPVNSVSIESLIAQAGMDVYQTRQLRLMVCSLADDAVVGCVDMFDFSPFDMHASLGVLVDTPFQRRGFATEALSLMCQYLHDTLALHQVSASMRSSNVASVSLFKKLGFDVVGVRKQWIRTSSGFEDEVLMQKIF